MNSGDYIKASRLILFGCALLFVLWPVAAKAWTWDIQTVDSVPSVRAVVSIALDSQDKPHIVYPELADAAPQAIKYAYFNGNSWNIQTVADLTEFQNVVALSIDVDSNDIPHIAYSIRASPPTGLYYATYNGSTWETSLVEPLNVWEGYWGGERMLVIDQNNVPHIAYSALQQDFDIGFWFGDLHYARYNGSSWDITTTGGAIGSNVSLDIDSLGNAHITESFNVNAGYGMRYSRYDGMSWSVESFDTGDFVSSASVKVDSLDRPHIAYSYGWINNPTQLKYTYFNGSSWDTEIVDNTDIGNKCPSLALDIWERPHIFYREGFMYFTGSSWQKDPDAPVPTAIASAVCDNVSLALDSFQWPHVAYFLDQPSWEYRYATVIPDSDPNMESGHQNNPKPLIGGCAISSSADNRASAMLGFIIPLATAFLFMRRRSR